MSGVDYPEEAIGEQLRATPVRPLDLTGRERQLRSAMTAMERIGQNFARYARRSMPFLTRQHARLVAGPVQVAAISEGEPLEAPTYSAYAGPSEGVVWGTITLNAFAVGITLEGALGGASNGPPLVPNGDLTPAQRSLLGRVSRSLTVDLCTAIQEEVGLAWRPLPPETQPLPAAGGDSLQVVCMIEGPEVPAKIVLMASAEALEAAARDQVNEGDSGQADPRLSEAMREVPMELVAELGRVKMGLRRVLSLSVGDVVRLKTAVDDTVCVRVGGVEKFQAMPVLSRGQLAIEIRSRRTR